MCFCLLSPRTNSSIHLINCLQRGKSYYRGGLQLIGNYLTDDAYMSDILSFYTQVSLEPTPVWVGQSVGSSRCQIFSLSAHLDRHRASIKTCDLSEIWSEWWGQTNALRQWLQFWELRNWIHDNLCYLTIMSDTGQHLQFLQCLYLNVQVIWSITLVW